MTRPPLIWIKALVLLLLTIGLATLPAQAAIVKLNGVMQANRDVESFRISQNSQYVVYRANQDTYQSFELYSVPTTGGTPVKLNGSLLSGFSVGTIYSISRDSGRVVYAVSVQRNGGGLVSELYSAPIGGPGPGLKLVDASMDGIVPGQIISPDNHYVVFRFASYGSSTSELYSVPIDGSAAPTKLNKTLVTNGSVFTEYQISPDSNRVVYVADQDTDNVHEVYSVPINGPASAGVKVSGAIIAGNGILTMAPTVLISPDSQRVVYLSYQDSASVHDAYSAPLDSSTVPVRLSSVLPAGSSVYPSSVVISPDSSRVIFVSYTNPREVYSVPIAGPAGSGVKLNSTLTPPNSVQYAFISPQGDQVVYAVGASQTTVDLYTVSITGLASASVQLNVAQVDYLIKGSGARLVYSTPNPAPGAIYSVPYTGPASASTQLTTVSGTYFTFQPSPDGFRMAYTNAGELYSVPITGPYTDSVKISGPMVTSGNVQYYSGFLFSPNGFTVVYRADQDADEKIELYATMEGMLNLKKVYLPLIRR